jgi:hypothetical protein
MSIRKKNGQINEKRNTYFSFHLFVLWLEDWSSVLLFEWFPFVF